LPLVSPFTISFAVLRFQATTQHLLPLLPTAASYSPRCQTLCSFLNNTPTEQQCVPVLLLFPARPEAVVDHRRRRSTRSRS
jgi:hypothetical protein